MELTNGTKTDIDAARVDLLRDVCTGLGLSEDLYIMRFEDFKVFGDYDIETLAVLFGKTWDAMPESQYKSALENAYEGRDGMNLTERRMDFAERHGSISTRTLIRHEQEGAELFVKYFDVVEAQYLKEREEEAGEDAARDADLEVMRRRLKKLEDGALLSRVADLEHIVQYQGIVLDALTSHLMKNVSPNFDYPYPDAWETIKEIQRRIDGNVSRDWLTGKGLPGQPSVPDPRPSR